MQNHFHLIFLRYFNIYFIFLTITACTTSNIEPEKIVTGNNYFPLKKGNFIIYDVERRDYIFATDSIADYKYQLMEVVADTFRDLGNNLNYSLERYKRPTPADVWLLDSVWTAYQTPQVAVKTENNMPFVKLIFPLKEGIRWNGNQANIWEEELYRANSLGKQASIGDTTFNNTVLVLQNTDSNSVNMNIKQELYALDIGLVNKYAKVMEFKQDPNTGLPVSPQKIEVGYIYKQKYRSHGQR